MIIISESNVLPEIVSDSEFLSLCSNVDVTELLEIMDDLMQDLAVLYPRKYNLILKAIARLKNSGIKLKAVKNDLYIFEE